MSLQTHLSHILPVPQAVNDVGEDHVAAMVISLLRLQATSSTEEEIQQDATTLVASMLYTSNKGTRNGSSSTSASSSGTKKTNNSHNNSDIPPPILNAWRSLQTPTLMLDKPSLIRFLVPVCAQPHVGPGGHMGLFDCLVYALQSKTSHNNNNMNHNATAHVIPSNPTNGSSLVSIPDIVIFLAICKNYWKLQNELEEENAIVSISSEHPSVTNMSLWMFFVYDAYQKKGSVVRDTIHRFLSDIHGEESFKTPAIRELLDRVFQHGDNKHLTSREFVQAIADTITYSPQPSHVLLDWMSGLTQAIQPQLLPAESTQVFLQTIQEQSRWLPQILDQYSLAEHRLYEIKRRFHSLVDSTSTVIQGDPMASDDVITDNSQKSNTSYSQQQQQQPSYAPKHVISPAVFYQAVCNPSMDQGHGGYVSQPLASRIFEGVVKMASSKEHPDLYWDLTHVLQFGGLCLRSADEEGIIKWILQYLLPSSDSLIGSRTQPEMTVEHVGDLFKLLCEHKSFRMKADKPTVNDSNHCDDPDVESDGVHVDMAAAMELGLVPESEIDTSASKISLQILIDGFLKDIGDTSTVSFEKLVAWHREQSDTQHRLSSFIVELRLICAVVFGVPPRQASLERNLIDEINRRHKQKYPQTPASRRGPRGTVWYLIDDGWYRSWNGTVARASSTPEDDQDLRDKDSTNLNPRRLGKILNRGLLRDGGSLALRVDIKWRNDYEIIPPMAWSALQAWYDGGPPIHRSVVPYISTNNATGSTSRANKTQMKTENEIELYPFFVTMFMCDSGSRGQARPFQQGVPVSRVSPIRVLLEQLCKGMDVDPENGRLWSMESIPTIENATPKSTEEDWLLDLDTNIVEQRKQRAGNESNTLSTIHLLLELKDPESGLWPRGEDGKTWTFTESDIEEVDVGDGIVGLYNMGNTCYMNSSIQCLSHTPIFRDYFTSKCYLKDINTTNPLGHQGRLAQVSAVLINSLWKRFNQQATQQPKRVMAPGSYAPVSAPSLTPKTFKDSLGKFNEIFEGNEQHDAQELLAFLLGGLSEDLNRIVEKPYIQAPDSDGRPDGELADIWWSNHLKREMSIIVALFTGQYKSLLKCTTCEYESARFEPFSFLQLPLPEDDTIPVNLILYPTKEGVDVLKYSVRVHNNGTLYDVLLSLSKVLYMDEHELPDTKPLESEDEESKERMNKVYADKAKDLVVVDMRDGYIFKIAPNAWRLPDLQNKDTGELPLLHVYELDPLPEANKGVDDEAEDNAIDCAFLALAQRKTETTGKEVLHPLTHRVFGTPLLLRIAEMESLTGAEVYDLVAAHLCNFVPPSALKFLHCSEENKRASVPNHESTMQEDRSKFEIRQNLRKTLSDMEEVAAGPVPRYGFRLRLASRDGRRCALCPWYDCCIGCLMPDDHNTTVVMNGDSLVIDWHLAVDVATNGFGSRGKTSGILSQNSPPRPSTSVVVKNHSSCGIGKKYGRSGATTLEDCLDAFAEEEKIPEAYCSKCRDFRIQTKRMSLWRLPPVVIIQLKRFQFTQHMRRKLRDFVEFPLEGLDLSRIMASDTNGTTPSEDDSNNTTPGSDESKGETDASQLNDDNGRNEMLYDLYGVVHHQGALSGGHYVASLKSDDGQWRLFNDAQIYEVHSRDVVDSSAYILFYIRRDVKRLKLEDFWNTSPAKEGEGLTEEEMETFIRERSERCVIS